MMHTAAIEHARPGQYANTAPVDVNVYCLKKYSATEP
jgi:hypothetical protein